MHGGNKNFRAPDGTPYDSYDAYVNAPDLDMDIIQSLLWRGKRKPQNEFERELKKSLDEDKKQGRYSEYYPE